MTDAWDGVPENPERDGWRIVRHKGNGAFVPRYWEQDHWHAGVGVRWPKVLPEEAALMWEYVGLMLTPAEVAAREAASAEAMREACAKHIEEVREWGGQDYYCDSCKGGAIYPDREDEGRRLRALPLPHASALARAEKAAYQRGWNDRESDFLAGAERTGMAVVGPNALAAAEKRGMERAEVYNLHMAVRAVLADADNEHGTRGLLQDALDEYEAAIRNAAAQEIKG